MRNYKNFEQVWNWKSIQRKYDALMNKAYINSCKRLVEDSFLYQTEEYKLLDVGAGSGLVFRHIADTIKEKFEYTGIDLNTDGLSRIYKRAEGKNNLSKIETIQNNICLYEKAFEKKFNKIYSNFCLYTIKDQDSRLNALKNIKKYLKPGGSFHISVPSEYYSATNIAIQCLKDELADSQNILYKAARSSILVPYQWKFVLKPIEAQINNGKFIRFNQNMIRDEFFSADLSISKLSLDYGFCGYHIHGIIK